MHRVEQPLPCSACPLQECEHLRRLTVAEQNYLEEFKQGEVRVDRGETVIEQDQAVSALYTVLDGVLIRFRDLDDGRRQIVNFMFPGDLVGLQAVFGGKANHSVEALKPARLCVFDRTRFKDLVADMPELGFDLTWLAAKEETALEGHLVSLGRRSAKERVAHLAIWLMSRAVNSCMSVQGHRLDMPITQAQIADMLGLSLVHTNRTIKALEQDGLMVWRQREIIVKDLDKLREFAGFEDDWRQPRPFI